MSYAAVFAAALLCAAAPAGHALDLASGNAHFSVPAVPLKQLRFAATLRQQYDFSCGSAALATLLTHHYGLPVDEATVFGQMYLHGDQARIRREGFSLLDMQRYLAGIGLRADGFQLPLDKLAEAGLPAIVLISEKGYHHFVVVKGLAAGRVLIGDPATGTRMMPRPAFDAAWPSRLLFVIHGRAARFNASADWRVAPAAPLAATLRRDSAANLTLPLQGTGDF